MFKYFKNKKINSLKEKFITGSIDRKEYLAMLYDIDYVSWKQSLTEKEEIIYTLTGRFNRNEITKEEYKEKIKPHDKDKWLSLASDEEKYLDTLEIKYVNKEITENEYLKEQATLKKEPYINFSSVQFDVGEKGKHALELDWNSFFIDELKKMGYTGQSEEDMVDKWFVAFCANIASESDAIIVTEPQDLHSLIVRKPTDL